MQVAFSCCASPSSKHPVCVQKFSITWRGRSPGLGLPLGSRLLRASVHSTALRVTGPWQQSEEVELGSLKILLAPVLPGKWYV